MQLKNFTVTIELRAYNINNMIDYNRNKFYISSEEQEDIRKYKVLFAGCGIGSNIAECALRLGFENMTLVDGDKIELTNLNRQNYNSQNVGQYKTVALQERLLSINPDASISTHNIFLDHTNVHDVLINHDVAINALDFQSDIPFYFDELCQQKRIPVLHPYNIGWATLLFIISPDGPNLRTLSSEYQGFEKKVASYLISRLDKESGNWIEAILNEYEKNGQGQQPPQLAVGSWLAGGACTNILYRLATGKSVKYFPEFYFLTI